MQGKKEFKQRIYYNINLDCLVPEDHFLKRLDRLVSFDFVRDITRNYYSHNRIDYKSNKKECNLCPLKGKCISGKDNFRIVSYYDSPCYWKARSWYDSGYRQAMQKLRGTILEGIMGQAKTYHGMAKARFRGLKKVEMQFLMTAAALNLKKMVKMLDIEEIKSSISRKFTDITQIVKDIFRNFSKKLAIEVS